MSDIVTDILKKKGYDDLPYYQRHRGVHPTDKYGYDTRLKKKYPRDRHSKSNREKRHVGPHDEDGLQRLLSTGKAKKGRDN